MDNENPNKAFQTIGAKARLSLNADVGSGNILATARTMEPPPPTTQRSRTTRKQFRRAKPGTANENEIQQGIPPLRCTRCTEGEC